VNALARHIIVAHTKIMAAHQDPSTVIVIGACWTGPSTGTAMLASYVTSLTFRGSHACLCNQKAFIDVRNHTRQHVSLSTSFERLRVLTAHVFAAIADESKCRRRTQTYTLNLTVESECFVDNFLS
jgi:hypothetical protein